MIREAAEAAKFQKCAHGLRESLASELVEDVAFAQQIATWTRHEMLKEVAGGRRRNRELHLRYSPPK